MNFDWFCSKIVFTFSIHDPNLVFSKSGNQRTNHLHPEYRLKWPGIRHNKKRGFTLIMGKKVRLIYAHI